jgi:dTDP-4-dehydrorhamnose 3,5-epimerase
LKVFPTELEGVLILEPEVFGDRRGFFLESYQQRRYAEAGVDAGFVQDNISFSVKRTLRGLHYQYPHAQAKLVQALQGEIFDVAVDIRKGSPTFGRWAGAVLSSENRRQLYVPEGFAHGFCVLSESALFMYKCSDYYSPQDEGGLLWNDSDLGIDWPVRDPILSPRDAALKRLDRLDPNRLPTYRR